MGYTQPSPFAAPAPPPVASPPPAEVVKPSRRKYQPPPLAACAVIPAGARRPAVLEAARRQRPVLGGTLVATAGDISEALAKLKPGDALVLWKLPAKRQGRQPPDPARDARIVALHAEGGSPKAIAAAVGVSRQTVARALERAGEQAGKAGSPLAFTPETDAELLARAEGGESVNAIAGDIGRPYNTVKRAIARARKRRADAG